MAKNNKIIINRETLPKGKQGGVDWFNTKEIEIYLLFFLYHYKYIYCLIISNLILDIKHIHFA